MAISNKSTRAALLQAADGASLAALQIKSVWFFANKYPERVALMFLGSLLPALTDHWLWLVAIPGAVLISIVAAALTNAKTGLVMGLFVLSAQWVLGPALFLLALARIGPYKLLPLIAFIGLLILLVEFVSGYWLYTHYADPDLGPSFLAWVDKKRRLSRFTQVDETLVARFNLRRYSIEIRHEMAEFAAAYSNLLQDKQQAGVGRLMVNVIGLQARALGLTPPLKVIKIDPEAQTIRVATWPPKHQSGWVWADPDIAEALTSSFFAVEAFEAEVKKAGSKVFLTFVLAEPLEEVVEYDPDSQQAPDLDPLTLSGDLPERLVYDPDLDDVYIDVDATEAEAS